MLARTASEAPTGDLLRPAAAERDGLIERVRQEVAQLEEFGVEMKSLEGLVDFRALRNGRPRLESEGKEVAAGVRFFERDPARLQLAIGPLDCSAIRAHEAVDRRLDDYRRVPKSVELRQHLLQGQRRNLAIRLRFEVLLDAPIALGCPLAIHALDETITGLWESTG